MTEKIPPAYGGDPNGLAIYLDHLQLWEIATSIPEERRGPLALMRMTGSVAKLRTLLSLERLAAKTGTWKAATAATTEQPATAEGLRGGGAVLSSGLEYRKEEVSRCCGRLVSETYFGKWRRLARFRRTKKMSCSDFLMSFNKLLMDFTSDSTAALTMPELLVALMVIEAANLSVEEHARVLLRLSTNLSMVKLAEVEDALRSVLISREDDDAIMALYAAEDEYYTAENERQVYIEDSYWSGEQQYYYEAEEATEWDEPAEWTWVEDVNTAYWVKRTFPKGKGSKKGKKGKGGKKGEKGKKGAGKGAGDGQKGFPGKCWKCNRTGHKASDCISTQTSPEPARCAGESAPNPEVAEMATAGSSMSMAAGFWSASDLASDFAVRGDALDRNDPKGPGGTAFRFGQGGRTAGEAGSTGAGP